MSRIVIALGGNALGNTYLEQQKLLKDAARNLVNMFSGNEVIITHGNGPQVGMITKAFANEGIEMPLDMSTAMSQGYIGFHIQREIKEVLEELKIQRDIVSVVSEVVVDENDSSFQNPTKPIGKFYTKEEAEALMQKSNDIYKEDAGRGYRKVVASPKPLAIKNITSIEALLKNNSIVIAGGGGGIPTFTDPETTKVEAVIDKDATSALLAVTINADMLVILTTVDQVLLNFGTENEVKIDSLSVEEAKQYLANEEFKSGSMRPKIEAAIYFTENTGKDSIITGLQNIENILHRKNITIIHK
ncbi:MAG: carbamate kinase [Mollicutes bacterium]|nr:carbamate kinase [Mollicutes bacterium]